MSSVKKKYLNYLKKEETKGHPFYSKSDQLEKFYLPICKKIYNYFKSKNKTILIGLAGSQGSGKSTITQIIKIILTIKFKINVVSFSIDDFYKTLKDRNHMSKNVHSLFATRGVPGTHDHKFIFTVLKKLKEPKFKSVQIPRFDKSIDDRLTKRNWQIIKKKPDIIIFEGWCVGAKPELDKNLKRPINKLESEKDKKMIWRKRVNSELKKNYKKVFDLIDKKIFLRIPNFKYVLKWRSLQEKKLKLKSKKKTMNNWKLKKFIMFYERISKNMIKNYKFNDIILSIDKRHRIKTIKFK